MLSIFKTIDGKTSKQNDITSGCWVHMCRPDDEEIDRIVSELSIDGDYLMAALDDEESPRVDSEEGDTLIIIDIPVVERQVVFLFYSPVGNYLHRREHHYRLSEGNVANRYVCRGKGQGLFDEQKNSLHTAAFAEECGEVFAVPQADRQVERHN